MSRCAVVFGQYGGAADPLNLPHFRERIAAAGIETILIQHYDSKSAYDFLHGYVGKCAIVGASLGAMSAVVFAGYLKPERVDFVGGFQPSDWDPSGHTVNIPTIGGDVITRAITVPPNVRKAICFRNPIAASTGGLGHATYILDHENTTTELRVIERGDIHPGDFGEAQDTMVEQCLEALK